MKYRKKPIVIEAIQFTGAPSVDEMLDEWGAKFQRAMSAEQEQGYLSINTLEGTHRADIGDWIIRGIKGEFYPCDPEIFEETYEEVSAPSRQT